MTPPERKGTKNDAFEWYLQGIKEFSLKGGINAAKMKPKNKRVWEKVNVKLLNFDFLLWIMLVHVI